MKIFCHNRECKWWTDTKAGMCSKGQITIDYNKTCLSAAPVLPAGNAKEQAVKSDAQIVPLDLGITCQKCGRTDDWVCECQRTA